MHKTIFVPRVEVDTESFVGRFNPGVRVFVCAHVTNDHWLVDAIDRGVWEAERDQRDSSPWVVTNCPLPHTVPHPADTLAITP